MRIFQIPLFGLLLTLLFCNTATNLSAQNNNVPSPYQVTGRIISNTDNKPIEFASLILYNENDSTPVDYTAADISGNFKLTQKAQANISYPLVSSDINLPIPKLLIFLTTRVVLFFRILL